jgi:DNA invertase Pin-like site-specific DNA recombinase
MARSARRKGASEPSGAPRFIAYYRVSTTQQGSSGLGLEAQRQAVARHVAGAGGELVDEFEEIESGKRNDRPQIKAALAACRAQRATLIIAKLDRLARRVSFISSLMEAGVEFVACDNPHATRLTIHILAAIAEHEREMISARTKAALAAAKARGVKLGNPRLLAGDRFAARAAGRVHAANAAKRATDIAPYIEAARRAGCLTLGEIAAALEARGIKTPGGCTRWSAEQVRRIQSRS